ncbi:hypothetical protein Lalb_Chr18g0060971 [Lupinus albus]|uniref:Uncharacterized protein n=1 Tax=Lupinus albus TaxID=3870 RepID=A0A6A4NXU4_LUPAL|nr:hypothetical protein Lalb_Chr18g0060971 [Lupinus albus]
MLASLLIIFTKSSNHWLVHLLSLCNNQYQICRLKEMLVKKERKKDGERSGMAIY